MHMDTPVIRHLEAQGVAYRLKPHDQPVYTSEEAAVQRGVRLSQIVKTMLLQTRDHGIVVAVLPGDRRLDVKRVKKLSGEKDLRFMDGPAIQEQLGLVVGAIAPVGETVAGRPVFVDPAVFDEELVDISSGDPGAGVEIRSQDLKRLLTGATVEVIGKEL